jgi:hypothetical protein
MKRYYGYIVLEAEDGDYVLYSDHKAEVERLQSESHEGDKLLIAAANDVTRIEDENIALRAENERLRADCVAMRRTIESQTDVVFALKAEVVRLRECTTDLDRRLRFLIETFYGGGERTEAEQRKRETDGYSVAMRGLDHAKEALAALEAKP